MIDEENTTEESEVVETVPEPAPSAPAPAPVVSPRGDKCTRVPQTNKTVKDRAGN